ncbi:hypothetical protein BN946_scf184992.g40 [Trametes cinnabarina]|uniref:DUF6534 domain-containing protein n=1 Tax=Pycnoporus cinnabarinus TaxID=5643 RepID=A0A060S4G0_PYCCI|nr:hypothetical protein BN946_scf184992.g40 [Trametes cinnabarina]
MLSFTLAFYLNAHRTGLRKSNDVITKLILLTVTTGMLTTLFNIADLIAYITHPDNLYVLCFNFMLGKLYANALLTSLNSREYVLKDALTDHETLGFTSSGSNGNVRTEPAEIHIAMDKLVVQRLTIKKPFSSDL